MPRHSFTKGWFSFFLSHWLRGKMCSEVEAGMPMAPAAPEEE